METSYLSQIKIFNHLDRIEEWLKAGDCFPVTIEIDPTNKCTRSCPHCAGNRFQKNDVLSLVFMKNVIRQIKPFCRGIIFTGGGEPLCNADTISAIEYAKKYSMEVALVTNGDLLDQKTSERLVQNCTYVRISHNDDNNWKKIRMLVENRKKKKSNCTIGIGILTSRKKSRLMEEFVKKAKRVGADYAQFRPYHLDTFDALPIIQKLQKEFNGKSFRVIASEYKYIDMKNRLKKTGEYRVCFADNFRMVIAADGKIYPDCWTRGMKNFCLGDLYRNNFRQIWKSKRRKEITASKLKQRQCPPMCYHDPLNGLLWKIWLQRKNGEHFNFV
jgi:GTP 3',8-cyclase